MQDLPTMMRQMLKSGVFLTLFAVAGSAMLAVTHYLTKPHIEENKRQSLLSNLNQVVPPETYDNALLDNSFRISAISLGHRDSRTGYVATRDGKPVAVILPVTAADGYSGDIHMIVGINTNGQLTGVRVVEHRETPGLGDAIEIRRSNWIRQFRGLSLDNPAPAQWAVKKDGGHFDSFTGATITPRAVVKAVRNALFYYDENKEQILD